MECTRAQQILSEALDDPTLDEALLREARRHCATCPGCASFAHALSLLERTATPEPSPALAGRIMAAIRTEEAASAGNAPANAPAAAPGEPPTPVSPAPLRHRRYRDMLVWAGAAAVVLVVAGLAASSGVRSILGPTVSPRQTASNKESVGTSGYGNDLASAPQAHTATDSEHSSVRGATSHPTSGFIELHGIAYRYAGVVSVDRSQFTTAGSVTTALDGTSVKTYTVYATSTAGRVVLISEAGTRAFDLVTRLLSGRAYVLTTQPLTNFSEWPNLPAGFAQPTAASGAPTFVSAGVDDAGVTVYAKPGTPIEDGFAIAPGTAARDPAQGDPNWTWWTKPQ